MIAVSGLGILYSMMVNRGRSKGCATCKQRRVKCDEAKPGCRSCRRLGLTCGGYKAKSVTLKFKNENHKFYDASDSDQATGGARERVTPSLPPTALESDSATSFFLNNYVNIGRSMESARGFYEVLMPVYATETQDSPLALAVSAVASRVWLQWTGRSENALPPSKMYAKAIARLRLATQDPLEIGKPATSLAVLMLQWYENVDAVLSGRKAIGVHQNGAVSLLPFAEVDHFNGPARSYMRKFLLHVEVSSALRQGRTLRSIAYSWIRGEDLSLAPDNPSFQLDLIGASVANLHARSSALPEAEAMSPSLRSPEDLWIEAKQIDDQLLDWAQQLPHHWLPQRLETGHDFDSSIPTYQSVCEVYPSCQIANIWNLWRVQRILLHKIMMTAITSCGSEERQFSVDVGINVDEKLIGSIKEVQELVDGACYSIPFYLGNQIGPSSMSSFTDSAIKIVDRPRARAQNEAPISCQDHQINSLGDEHRREIIAQGAWHILSPLSRLLTLFAEDPLAVCLRPEQYQWIREQFVRSAGILNIPSTGSDDGQDEIYTSTKSTKSNTHLNAEDLAREVRKGGVFMSGP